MSLVLLKPEHDIWEPGEHNGTFRGNNLAFVTATEAIKFFWSDNTFRGDIQERIDRIRAFLNGLAQAYPDSLKVKGRGMMKGLAKSIQEDCFGQGLIIELCGPHDEVLKLLPPLNISADQLEEGLSIIAAAAHDQLKEATPTFSEVAYG